MNKKIDKKIVNEYLISLIIGVVVLFIMWKAVVFLSSGLPQFSKSIIGIGAGIIFIYMIGRDMSLENRIKLMGSILILILAVFWAAVLSVEPNFILRILFFAGGFGGSAFGLTLPLVWLVRSLTCQSSEEICGG